MKTMLLVLGCCLLITGCLMVAWGAWYGILPALVGLYMVMRIDLSSGVRERRRFE